MTTWRPLRPPPSERDPRGIGDALDRVSRRLGGPKAKTATAVFDQRRWEELVGLDIAAHARPVTLRGGILTLAVDNPAWAAQLGFMTQELVERIAGAAGAGEVREIRLRVVG